MRSASSSLVVAAQRTEVDPAFLPQRPIKDVEQPVMPFDRAQACDGRSRRDMKEGEAAIATLRRHRAGVEGAGFDREDDFVIRHRVLVTDRQAAVRAFPLSVLIQNVGALLAADLSSPSKLAKRGSKES